MLGILDSGPLVSVSDTKDPKFDAVAEVLRDPSLSFVIPSMCVAEATYLVQVKYGPVIEARFIEGLSEFEVVAPTSRDFVRMAELMRQYADFPLGGTDASVVALAERLETDLVVTLDQRHFRAVQPRHCRAFRILPAIHT